MSEEAKLLVAVSAGGMTATIINGVGADIATREYSADHLNFDASVPCEPGLHVWEGVVVPVLESMPPVCLWAGSWRRPNGEEWARLMLGMSLWGAK